MHTNYITDTNTHTQTHGSTSLKNCQVYFYGFPSQQGSKCQGEREIPSFDVHTDTHAQIQITVNHTYGTFSAISYTNAQTPIHRLFQYEFGNYRRTINHFRHSQTAALRSDLTSTASDTNNHFNSHGLSVSFLPSSIQSFICIYCVSAQLRGYEI